MNISNVLWLISLLVMTACVSNHTDDSNQPVSIALVPSDSIAPNLEEPQFTEFTIAVHDLFKKQHNDVVNAIAQEDFELAVEKINYNWLNNEATLTETQKANLRYMYIYSMAGLVIQKKHTRTD